MCRALANQLREQNHADADDLASARAVVRSRAVCCEDRERKGEIVSDLIERLRRHLRTLSPHIRERLTGQLLIEAADEIERLSTEIGEWCRAATSLEESDDEAPARTRLSELRTGNGYCHQPPCAVEITMTTCEELRQRIERLESENANIQRENVRVLDIIEQQAETIERLEAENRELLARLRK